MNKTIALTMPAPLAPGFQPAVLRNDNCVNAIKASGQPVPLVIGLDKGREVLKPAFPKLAAKIEPHVPDEKARRAGQAVAAASLPEARKELYETA